MISIQIFILTNLFLIGIILFQNFWHQKRTDKLENSFHIERENYIQRILDNKSSSDMGATLLETLNGAHVVYQDELEPYQDEIKGTGF